MIRHFLTYCAAVSCVLVSGCSNAPENPNANAVVVAKNSFQPGDSLSADQLEERVVPNPPDSAYKRTIDVIGLTVGAPIAVGDVITPTSIDIGMQDLKKRTSNGVVEVAVATKNIAKGQTFSGQNVAVKQVPAAPIKITNAGECPVFSEDAALELKATQNIKAGQMITRATVGWRELPR